MGRTRANNTYFLDVVDNGFASLRRYYTKKRPMFSKYAESVNDINVTDTNLENRFVAITAKIAQQHCEQLSLFQEHEKKSLTQIVKRV